MKKSWIDFNCALLTGMFIFVDYHQNVMKTITWD